MTKPTDDLTWATDGGATVAEPSALKKLQGWIFEEKPPASWFNWLLRAIGRWTNWLGSAMDKQWLNGAGPSMIDTTIVTTDDFTCVHCNGNEVIICDLTQSRYSSNSGKTFAAAVAVGGFTTIRDIVSNADGSHWVVVGDPSGNNGFAYSSNNGTSWTGVSTGAVNLSGVCYSPDLGMYCGVGDTGTIYTSTNGTSITSRTCAGTAANITFYDVCWSEALQLFIAVGSDTTGGNHVEIQTSPDGITWTARTGSGSGTQALCVSEVDFISSTVIVLGCLGGQIQYSADGITWSTHGQSAAYGSGLYGIQAVPGGALFTYNSSGVLAIYNTNNVGDPVPAPSGNISTNAAISFSNEAGVIVVGSNGAISKSYPYLLD